MTHPALDLPALVRMELAARNWKGSELARRLGRDPKCSSLNRWLNGEKPFRKTVLCQIMNLLTEEGGVFVTDLKYELEDLLAPDAGYQAFVQTMDGRDK